MRISDWSSDVCSSDLLDRNVLELIDGADLVIYDSTYTDDEFAKYRGWGHSTWQEGVRLCDKAAVRKLVLFHHDPRHDDAFMDRVAREAESARPGTVVARAGLLRSEEHTSELQSLMRISYAVFS